MRYLILLIALLVGGTFLLPNNDFPDYRYKMTIYAGGQAYSSVREVTTETVLSIVDSGGQAIKSRLEGEAVVLDLPSRSSPVFALLSRQDNVDYAKGIAGAALKPVRDEGAGHAGAAKYMQHMVAVDGPRDLPRTRSNNDPYRGPREIQLWPMFVTFDDPSDWRTVREVTPESIGVRRITIEITDEHVSEGIESRLPWLAGLKGRSLSGRVGAIGSPYGLHAGSFVVRGKD